MNLSFDNTKNAFAYKNTKDLKMAKFLFSTMRYPLFVPIATRLTPLFLKMKLPINGIVRSTIFKQFVGGETLQETAGVVDVLNEYHVKVILDYGVEGKEGEENFDKATQQFIDVIEYAATQTNIPFMSIKVTGLARFGLLETLNEAPRLRSGIHDNEMEIAEWERVKDRLYHICDIASQKNIGVLIDAEETWIQDPVDRLVMELMQNFNTTKAVVYNTIQSYRHDRLDFLKLSHKIAKENNFILGIKLVRGAYMEKERARAIEKKYLDPIHKSKASTDNDFNVATDYCINNIDSIASIIASHNEQSNLKAVQLMQEKNISPNHPHIHFSQLFGMSDNITFNLAAEGCSVSKYLPFGPINDVIPYLMRRAQENSSVGEQTGRELGLIQKELRRRKSSQE